MIAFIVRRILWAVPVIWIVATLTFFLMHIVPGGPFDQEKVLPPEIKANVDAKYHLNESLSVQYRLYLWDLMRGDLGPSFKYTGRTVNDVIRDTLPVSAQLGVGAFVVSVFLGVGLGLASAWRPRSGMDHAASLLSAGGISLPNFVLGTLLIILFSYRLHWFPAALWEGGRHAVLPVITLAVLPASYIARLTRSSLLEIGGQDYIRTARAKGLGEGAILLKHALKNSLTPVISFLGPLMAALITGSFVVEFVFSVPGMGKYFITAVTNRDYPLIMGVTLVYAVFIIGANILVDILYGWVDPRMRIGRSR